MLVGVVADNLDGVLVCTNSTVSTQSVELGLEHAFSAQCHLFNLWQRCECNIVNDTNSEMVFGLWQCQIVEYRNDLGWCGVA